MGGVLDMEEGAGTRACHDGRDVTREGAGVNGEGLTRWLGRAGSWGRHGLGPPAVDRVRGPAWTAIHQAWGPPSATRTLTRWASPRELHVGVLA